MSTRRKPGEIVIRKPGSGFTGTVEPKKVQVPKGKAYEYDMAVGPDGNFLLEENIGGEATPCLMGCGDPYCREWANLEVVSGDFAGQIMYHISECQMEDA